MDEDGPVAPVAAKGRFGLRTELIVVAVASILAILAGELALRAIAVFDPFPRYDVGEFESAPNGYMVPDDEIGWRVTTMSAFIAFPGVKRQL